MKACDDGGASPSASRSLAPPKLTLARLKIFFNRWRCGARQHRPLHLPCCWLCCCRPRLLRCRARSTAYWCAALDSNATPIPAASPSRSLVARARARLVSTRLPSNHFYGARQNPLPWLEPGLRGRRLGPSCPAFEPAPFTTLVPQARSHVAALATAFRLAACAQESCRRVRRPGRQGHGSRALVVRGAGAGRRARAAWLWWAGRGFGDTSRSAELSGGFLCSHMGSTRMGVHFAHGHGFAHVCVSLFP